MSSSKFTQAINTETQYREASKTLSREKRPPAVLRMLMNSFESYRQARKFGWSRPWNKVDLMNFQSFKLDPSNNPAFIRTASDLLNLELLNLTKDAQNFAEELLADKNLMGFVFIHEFTEGGKQYEGATLSLGRKNQKRYRDRIDIIFESPVIAGISQGLERIRVYIDPYRENDKKTLWQGATATLNNSHAESLFAALSEVSWEWAGDEKRVWDHWTSAYIDYFGERQ
ncbi:MAG: hypothetical protein KAJ95_07270, partial [Gammaproteobacteria bacterium]|nr:hypothetical protein [Gammaproteobacteria bacterium]